MKLKDFRYQRPNVNTNNAQEQDPINAFSHYGEIDVSKDSDWLYDNSTQMYQTLNHHMVIIQKAIKDKQPVEDIKKLHTEFYKSAELFLDDILKNRLNLEHTAHSIMYPQDPSAPMLQEIRQVLRSEPDRVKRRELVEKKLNEGDFRFIEAAFSSPDDIVSRDFLKDLSFSYSTSQNNDLESALEDNASIYNHRRKRAAQMNASIHKMLQANGYDPDECVDLEQHYKTFIPQSDRLERIAKRRILKQKADQETETD